MSKDLAYVYNRLQKTLDANFSKPLEIVALVSAYDQRSFSVKTLDNDKILECFYKDDIIDIKVGDMIKLNGWLKMDPNVIGEIFLSVDYYYIITNEDKYGPALDVHNKLVHSLSKDKFKKKVNLYTRAKAPKNIYNIALIVMPNNEQNIENFKALFADKCTGKIFVYHLKYAKMETSIGVAMEYFKKYHEIDLICLLTNQITLADLCGLSSVKNISYMINRIGVPYTISVISQTIDNDLVTTQRIQPLTAMLSNKTFDGLTSCINFIHGIQTLTKTKLTNGIQLCKNKLQIILEQQKQKLFDLQIYVADMIDDRQNKNLNNNTNTNDALANFEKVKFMLFRRLDRLKIKLGHINTDMMRSILSTPQIKQICQRIIDNEKRLLAYAPKSQTVENDNNKETNLILFDEEKINE